LCVYHPKKVNFSLINQITSTATFQAIKTDPKTRSYWVVGIALVFATLASIGMRAAQQLGMSYQVVVFWRLFPAFVILTPLVIRRYRGQLANISRRDLIFILASGLMLGIHFNFLAASLIYSTILVSQVITNTGPIWVAILEVSFFKEKLGRWVIMGILLAFVGGIVIALAPYVQAPTVIETTPRSINLPDPNPLLGAGLGLAAAIFAAIYLLIGRQVRARVSVIPYIWMVDGIATFVSLVFAIVSQKPIFGYVPEAFMWVIAVAVFVTLLAHGAFNYAVGYLPATIVSISSQVVSVLAGIVAFLFLSETPLGLEIAGSLVIIVGVMLSIIGQRKPNKVK
jgi:drug/metabolite transporter (DMT)-like permease